MPATVSEIIKMFYNCGGERQTFSCRLLTPTNADLPPSSEGLPLSCEGPPPSSVLLPSCCVVWRGTRKRRHQRGITALWDGRPTLREADRRYGTADRRYVKAACVEGRNRATWCAMERQTDTMGRQTDAMGRQTDVMWRQTCAEGRNRAAYAFPRDSLWTIFHLSRHGDVSQSNAVSGTDSEWRCGPFYTFRHTTPYSGAVP